MLPEREPELLPEEADPLDDFEPDPDDLEPPDFDPEPDFLAEELLDRPLDDLPEPLFDEPLFDEDEREPLLFDEEEPPLFELEDRDPLPPLLEDVEREPPLFDDDPRELPPLLLFEDEEPRDEEEPFDDELFDEEPEDFLPPELEEPLFDEPDDLVLPPPPLEDFPLDEERDEPLFDDEPERLLPPELFLVEEPFDEDPAELPAEPLVPPAFAANADCTTVAAPSTAPIAAAVARLPAASAAFASKPLLPFLRDDPFDDVLFFDLVLVVAI